MSKRADFTASDGIFRGEDKSLAMYIVNESGDPQTMTGWALSWTLRRAASASATVLTKTTGAGSITIGNGDGTDDRAIVTILDTDTEALSAGTYEHALRRTDAGYEQVLAYGIFVLQDAA